MRLAAIYRPLGLTGDPFAIGSLTGSIAPLPSRIAHRHDLLGWLRESREAPSLAVVTGDPGSGCSTLLADVVAGLAGDSAFRPLPVTLSEEKLTDLRLLRAIIDAFGGESNGRTGLELIQTIRDLVAATTAAGEHPLLILDDAELAGSRLEILRSLLTPPDGAPAGYDLRILLTGSHELRDRLIRRRTLSRQIACSVALEPLGQDEVAALIAHRIAAVRANDDQQTTEPAFAEDAIDIVSDWSGGNPAAVIHLAGECLLEAIARGQRHVSAEIAHDVARDLTDRARQIARAEAEAPYVLPAVQTKLALTLVDDHPEPAAAQQGSRGSRSRSRSRSAR